MQTRYGTHLSGGPTQFTRIYSGDTTYKAVSSISRLVFHVLQFHVRHFQRPQTKEDMARHNE